MPADLSLRDRKKAQTRENLVAIALTLFTARGFDAVTLDELCAATNVSKRTFFRYYASKEDVALAPLHTMWTHFLAALETASPDGRTLLTLLRDQLVAALHAMPDDGWARQAATSQRLSQTTPSIGAHALAFCDRTTRAALDVLSAQFQLTDPDDPRPRLCLDLTVAAFNWSLRRWAEYPNSTRDDLIRAVVTADVTTLDLPLPTPDPPPYA